MLLSDYDWAENGILELARQIQSEYWALVAYSLFISITAFLDVAQWKRRDGALPRGSEVTVEPEGAPADSVEPARGSYYATVADCGPDGAYALLDADGVPLASPASRAQLRHRVWRTTAFVTVTNEKRHDGVTTQHVLNEQLKHWGERSATAATQEEIAQRLVSAAAAAAAAATAAAPPSPTPPPATGATATTQPTAPQQTADVAQPIGVAEAAAPTAPPPQPVPSPAVQSRRFKQWLLEFDENRFWAWLGHSDNATHFKSSGMFYYWSNVTTKHDFLKHLWISFGCPGHGKGPWDGYGAVIKSYVRNTNTKGTTRITTPRAAAEAIERHFCTPEYEDKHANAKIQKVVVTFIEAADIPRDVRAPSYSRLVGQKSAFSCAAPPSPLLHPHTTHLLHSSTCFILPALPASPSQLACLPPVCTGTCRCGLAPCSPARRATGAMAASVGGRLATA
jgi:hypothetical protein